MTAAHAPSNLNKHKNNRTKIAVLFVILFAALATAAIILSQAASNSVAVEAEAGVLASPASTVNNANASGGKYVVYGVAQCPPGTTGTPPNCVATSSYIIYAAGDIATSATGKNLGTSNIIVNAATKFGALTLGDNVYPDGMANQFTADYAPTWGRFKNITYPSPGNHDYHVSGAADYYSYFNATASSITGHTVAGSPNQGYYAFDVGPNWRLYSLNSEANQSAANTFLGNDMKANPRPCTLAYWHKPRWSSGSHHGSDSSQGNYWTTLYNNGGDVVLSGHDHEYERFAPQDPSGKADAAKGIREFVVGTGGAGLYDFGTPLANSEVRGATSTNAAYGVIKLTLKSNGYDWQFVPSSGTFTDSGSSTCH